MIANPTSAHAHARFGDILLPSRTAASQALLNDAHLELTYNGRGALLRAFTEIASRGKRNILLPAYHCPSGISPAIHAGLLPVFFRVRRDLSIDFDDLYAKADAHTAAVLVIHYFGIATDIRPIQALRRRGVAIIEDWSHSFLQGSPPRLSGCISDYRVYSFWKLVPSVVGGGLWRRDGDGDGDGKPVREPMPAPPVRERVVRLKRMLEAALHQSDYTRAKAIFASLEEIRVTWRRGGTNVVPNADEEPPPGESHYPFDLTLARSRMPGLARRVIESTDFASLAQRRRDNFVEYGRWLHSSGRLQVLYPVLPVDSCPWVFPVLLQRRNETDHHWRAAGVALHTFGNYLHSALFKHTDMETIADARYLSGTLLCLAIHQDLSPNQIERSAATINHYLAAPSA